MTKEKLLQGAMGAVALVLLAVLFSADWQSEPPRLGQPAPDFSFTWQGQQRSLGELRGRVVVLNFWATWCAPCVEEMPSLERLHRKLAERGVVVLGVSVDEDAEALEKFLRDFRITFPTHRDPNWKLARRYGTKVFPETYILNREGRLERKVIGATEWDNPEILFYLTRLAAAGGIAASGR